MPVFINIAAKGLRPRLVNLDQVTYISLVEEEPNKTELFFAGIAIDREGDIVGDYALADLPIEEVIRRMQHEKLTLF